MVRAGALVNLLAVAVGYGFILLLAPVLFDATMFGR